MLRVRTGALAASLALLCAPAALAQTTDWTGFYAGTHIGNASVHNDWKSATGSGSEFRGSFTGGGLSNGFQAGYNYQTGRWVFGVEATATLADIDGAARCDDGVMVCDALINGLGTLALRGGYAFDRFLVYGKAGGALLHEHLKMAPTPGLTQTFVGKAWRPGWTVGAGLEYALTPSLAVKAEYDYLSFDGDVAMTGNEGGKIDVALAQQVHLIKVGLNYRLGRRSPFERSLWSGSGVASSHDWTGVYAGVHAGGGFGRSDWNSATGGLATLSTLTFPGSGTVDGSIAGGQIGYNKQIGSWVFGAELAASWANIDGYAKCASSAAGTSLACHSRIDGVLTATGRVGQTYGNVLLYGLGGFAVAREHYDIYRSSLAPRASGSHTRTGYVLGSGVEYAFTPALSGKAEYNYIDFDEKSVAFTGGVSTASIGQNVHLFKFGLNYKLGADPYASHADTAPFANSHLGAASWTLEAGLRYFYSQGKTKQDLYSGDPAAMLLSRLNYGGLQAHAAETFVRADHDSHVFLKGNFGLGSIVGGSLYDEDMPPGTNPYSATNHAIKDSSLRYGAFEIGYNVIDGAAGSLGPYAGYRYFYQRARGFGCRQVATNPGICAAGIPPQNVALTETETWRGVAVGLNTRMKIAPRWTVEVDAAYLPYVDRAGVDNHWARADINPGPENGTGWGAQIEGIVSYAVTPRFSFGIGGRYGYYSTFEASTPFPLSGTQPLKYTSDRYGGFMQASYKIGGSAADSFAADEDAKPVTWTGLYAGGHLGAGVGKSSWSDPYPAPVLGDNIKTAGALGGAQIGFNAQFGRFVAGAELSGSFARAEGTDTCFGGHPNQSVAALQCENTTMPLATITGRAGYAFGRSLIYGRAGAVVARNNYAVNARAAGGEVFDQTVTDWGWTVGGGLEHALSSRWSVNVDYKYVDFGSRSLSFDLPAAYAAATPNGISSHQHLMTLGVNYHFTPMEGR